MSYALSALVVAIAFACRWYATGDAMSPDGARYMQLAKGIAQPSPFHRRWLLPSILGTSMWRWRLMTFASTVAMGPLLCAYTGSPWAAALYAGLPLVRVNAMFPVLVDAPAMALALGSAVAWQHGHPLVAGLLAGLAGFCKEPGIVFAIVFSGEAALLPGIWLLVILNRKPAAFDSDVYCGRPIREVALRIWRERRHEPLSWPHAAGWGVLAVLAPLGAAWDRATLLACIAVALAYGRLIIATDSIRLYLWACPCVIAVAVRGADPKWIAVACVVGALCPNERI